MHRKSNLSLKAEVIGFEELARDVWPGDDQSSLNDIRHLLSRWSTERGFSKFMFRLVLTSDGERRSIALIHNYPSSWKSYYRDNLLYRIDPVVRHCQENSDVIFWTDIERPPDVDKAEYTKFLRQARFAGIQHGISFPMHGPFGEWGMLNLNCSTPLAPNTEGANDIVIEGKSFCAQVQATVRRLFKRHSQPPKYGKLTTRQKECLLWSIEGKTAWETSQILGISERTVVYHIQNSFDTLNVLNRAQATARAYAYLFADLGFMHENADSGWSMFESCGAS